MASPVGIVKHQLYAGAWERVVPIELRQLRYVVAVAEAGGFTRAAERVHISQPSLSQQVRRLEEELGAPLFYREHGGTTLTPAGEAVVCRAQEVLQRLEAMKQELADLEGLRQGRLTIGSLPITGGHVLPPVVAAYRKQYPGIQLHLVEERTPNLLAITLAGQTDLSVLTLPLDSTELSWEPLIIEDLLLAVPREHRLARDQVVTLAQVADESFVLLKKGNGFRTVCDEACRLSGFTPHCAFETDNIETAKSLVAAGLGVTLVPRMIAGVSSTLTDGSQSILYRSLSPSPTRTVVVAWKSDRYLSKAAHAFIALLKSCWSR